MSVFYCNTNLGENTKNRKRLDLKVLRFFFLVTCGFKEGFEWEYTGYLSLENKKSIFFLKY